MNRTSRKLLLLPLIALLAPISFATNTNSTERTSEQWLEDMNTALRELNYKGTISHFDGSDLSTLHFSHVSVDGVEYERMCHLNGPRRELLRSGSKLFLYVEEHEQQQLTDLMEEWPKLTVPILFSKRFNSLEEVYVTSMRGENRVAERDAVVIEVSPKRPDRYGFRLWIDKDTSLLLRAEMRDDSDTLLEAVVFTSIEIDTLTPAEFMNQVDVSKGTVIELPMDENGTGAVASADNRWAREWVPQGFAVYKAENASGSKGNIPDGSNIHYSDGIVTFSLFIEKTDPSGMGDIETFDGPTTVVSRRTTDKTGIPYRVTVVGELPKHTAWRIARGVKPVR